MQGQLIFESTNELFNLTKEMDGYCISIGDMEVYGPYETEMEAYQVGCEKLSLHVAKLISIISQVDDAIQGY